jgi:hypothetical protein
MVRALVVSAVVLASGAAAGPAPQRITVDDFESKATSAGLPAGWEELYFEKIPGHTTYTVRQEGGDRFLHAEARRSASGLVKRLSVDLQEYPLLKWRWRVPATLPKGDARRKSGDDYPARLYVNFRYDPERVGFWTRLKYSLAKKRLGEYPPLHTVNYIWANKLERGTFLPNAFTDRAMMIAVRSGDEDTGQWLNESRNVYADYRRAFAEEPTRVIAVAVMTDTDNTGSAASADYDDIRFEAPPDESRR